MGELALARPLSSNDPASITFMYEDLARSGLEPSDLAAYPVSPIAAGTCPGYCIPYNDPRMYRIRYKRDDDKYIQPKGIQGVWWSPTQDKASFRASPTLYIIEGEKKAAKFVKRWPHLPALGIGGCWMFAKKNSAEIKMLLPDILSSLTPGMNVVAIFDGDILSKPAVQAAAATLNSLLAQQQCVLKLYRPPLGKGVDDWLVADPNATLHNLMEIPLEDLEVSRRTLYDLLEIRMSDKGFPIPNESNIKKLLLFYYDGRLQSDRRLGILLNRANISFEKLQNDASRYIQEQHIAMAPMTRINCALDFALQEVESDVVKDYVEGLEWDGEPRLNSWAIDYFTSNIPEYLAEWGRLLMTALVFRILEPGFKVDFIPILVGPQKIGKTTFFEELAVFDGRRYYHSCTAISPDIGDQNRTQCAAFAKTIIVDLGEGAAFNPKKLNQENFKQFITQTADEYRKVYEKSTTVNPRSFIFVGTSNRGDQITDRTGSRRFLPVAVTSVRHLPYDEKIQILAEVVAKRQEILDTEWWQPAVDWEKMPQELRDEHSHVKDPQMLVNSMFTRTDEFEEWLCALLEAGECATYKNTGEMFITSPYLKHRYQALGHNAAFIGSKLTELSHSPMFPWILIPNSKPRIPMLIIPKDYLHYYLESIANAQGMLTGYKAIKR